MSTLLPSIPMYALVDFDADGLSILSTYKDGSARLAHETEFLSTPRLHWLGVRSSDIPSLGTTPTGTDVMPALSVRNRKKAIKMLERSCCDEDGAEAEWSSELQTMLMLNLKAEIEILDHREGGLQAWLMQRLVSLEADTSA